MKIFCVVLFCVFVLFSCGYRAGVVQKTGVGYLQFSGVWDANEITVQVDDRQPFKLRTFDAATLFETTPGKHSLKVFQNEKIVVDRVVFLEGQATFEVKVP